MRKFITWLASWFRSVPGEDGHPWEIADDCHDSIDPQVVTRVCGGGFEKGNWK